LNEEVFFLSLHPRKNVPPFLDRNPEFCSTFKHYDGEHLVELSKPILPKWALDIVGKERRIWLKRDETELKTKY
jgi:hypothetical protein